MTATRVLATQITAESVVVIGAALVEITSVIGSPEFVCLTGRHLGDDSGRWVAMTVTADTYVTRIAA